MPPGTIASTVPEGGSLRAARRARLVLGLAMIGAAGLLLWFGRGIGLNGDDLFFYARLANRALGVDAYPNLSAEYLLAPHNNHLHLTVRLAYEGLFATAGTNYLWFRLVEVAGVVIAVGLFFELTRTRVGPWAALAPSLLLLVFGYAWEVLLWPANMGTVYALAAGLGALLLLERRPGLRGEIGACALLTLAVATIELGLAFAVALGVLLLAQRRFSALWVAGIPLALYIGWYLWSRQFHQTAYHVTDPIDLLHSIALSSGAVIGSILAVNPVPADSPLTVGTRAWPILSLLAAAALGWRIWRGPNHPYLWALLALVGSYWLLIAIAGRPPDSSRYLFAGTVVLLLLAAEALRGQRLSFAVVASIFLVVAVGIPRNIDLLTEGRDLKLDETTLNRVEAGAEQLVGSELDPGYSPAGDPIAAERGGVGPTTISAGDYLRAAGRIAPFGYSASEIAGLSARWRNLADVVLAHAGGLTVRSAPPSAARRCRRLEPTSRGEPVAFLIDDAVSVGSTTARPVEVAARLFGSAPFRVGSTSSDRRLVMEPSLRPGLPRRWEAIADSAVSMCSAGARP